MTDRAVLDDLRRFRELRETRNERKLNGFRVLVFGFVLVVHALLDLTPGAPFRPSLISFVPLLLGLAGSAALPRHLHHYHPARKYLVVTTEVALLLSCMYCLKDTLDPLVMGLIPVPVILVSLILAAMRYSTRLLLVTGLECWVAFVFLFTPLMPAEHRAPASVSGTVLIALATSSLAFIVHSLLGISREAVLKQAHSQRKSAFLGWVSHELSQPVSAIGGYCQMLLEGLKGELKPSQRQAIERIQGNAGAIQSLTSDLLDISKIEEGRLRLHFEPLDLEQCLSAASHAVAPQAAARGLVIRQETEPATVVGDYQRLHQVFVNLLGNAVRYTPQGQVGIRLQKRNGAVEASVWDTGPGIPPADRERIFEEFWKGEGGGTGLGLAISRRLVELHGGTLELHPPSTFVVTLRSGSPPPAPTR